MSASPPWGDTPFSELNFGADCAASARYVASSIDGMEEASLSLITRFFEAVVPGASDLNATTVSEWHGFLKDRDFIELWRDSYGELGGDLKGSESFRGCTSDLCTTITRSFPNDVIGIGLLVAVTIEFLLMIGYCAAALYPYVAKKGPASGSGPLHRILHAFYSTKGHFFHLALMFCMGVSVAVIYDGVTTIATNPPSPASSPRTYYGAGGSLMGAVYFPLAATIPSYLWNSRRQWRDGALAAVALVLVSVAIVFVPFNYDIIWPLRRACPGEHFPSDIDAVTARTVHGLATWTPGLLLLVMGITVSCFKCSGKRMWEWRPMRLVFRWLVVIYAGLAFLGAISYSIILLVLAGRTTWVSQSWGLGQGIALVLWIPLVYEIIHVAIGMSFPPPPLVSVPSMLTENQLVLIEDSRSASRRSFALLETSMLSPRPNLIAFLFLNHTEGRAPGRLGLHRALLLASCLLGRRRREGRRCRAGMFSSLSLASSTTVVYHDLMHVQIISKTEIDYRP